MPNVYSKTCEESTNYQQKLSGMAIVHVHIFLIARPLGLYFNHYVRQSVRPSVTS